MLADTSNPSPAPGRKIGPRDDEFSLMLYYELLMRILPGLLLLALAVVALPAQQSAKSPDQPKPLPGKFTDVTTALGLRFQYMSSHTPNHYLPTPIAPRVPLFDYNTNGH